MKKGIILVMAVTASIGVFGQAKNVNKASMAYTKGDFAVAAAEIEPAILDEKTSIKSKTWYLRGQIYDAIATSTDAAINAIDPDALQKGVDSYRKVLEMEKDGSSYHGLAEINLTNLTGSVLNKGVEAYQADDYAAALAAFDSYSKIVPDDTTGYIYAAIMAQQMEQYEDVVKYYEGAFNIDYYPKNALNTVIYYNLNQLENPEKALEYAELAKEKYPDDNNFQKTEVDILIKLDKMDQAIAELQHAIEHEPDNAMLYSNLGMLYDSQEKSDLAVAEYKKALEIDPTNRFSLINMAVFYVNQGDKINHEAIDMDMATFRKEGEKYEARAKEEWAKAIPLLEKVLEANDADELALQNLHAIYYKMKDYKKAKEIEDRRRALGYLVD